MVRERDVGVKDAAGGMSAMEMMRDENRGKGAAEIGRRVPARGVGKPRRLLSIRPVGATRDGIY
jgi:hypothetical protein